MSKVLFILDPGHGGLINGKYVTPGKRSPYTVGDHGVLYEGVNNRDNVNRILAALKEAGLDAIDVVSSDEDISLGARVERANKQASKRKCMYISVHSDAAAYRYVDKACTKRYDEKIHGKLNDFFYKEEWHEAKGITGFTSPGQTESDKFADIFIGETEKNMGGMTTIRKDTTDGDKDKEAKFYVLTETTCPAILIEVGFHTNEKEATLMLTNEWKNALTKSVVDACKKWEELCQ
jgi:N-acetylmuramoyl-L-alanine amidase